MRTEQVRYFLETVKLGSFTKAAENLHIQQPSLREAIINLENELGETLFYRSKKGVQLTEYGRYCLPYFQLIYESYGKMKQKEGFSLKKSTKLCIDVQSNYETFLALFYNTLMPQLKEAEIRINTNNDINAIVTRLIQDQIDLGFICQSSTKTNEFFEAVKVQNLEQSVIDSFEVVVLMKKNHPLAEKEIIDYEDLYKYKLVLNTANAPSLNFLVQKIDINGLDIIKTGSWKLAESYLGSQMAITFTAKDAYTKDDFVIRSLKDAPTMTMSALYKKGMMNEKILRCINVMKLATGNYI